MLRVTGKGQNSAPNNMQGPAPPPPFSSIPISEDFRSRGGGPWPQKNSFLQWGAPPMEHSALLFEFFKPERPTRFRGGGGRSPAWECTQMYPKQQFSKCATSADQKLQVVCFKHISEIQNLYTNFGHTWKPCTIFWEWKKNKWHQMTPVQYQQVYKYISPKDIHIFFAFWVQNLASKKCNLLADTDPYFWLNEFLAGPKSLTSTNSKIHNRPNFWSVSWPSNWCSHTKLSCCLWVICFSYPFFGSSKLSDIHFWWHSTWCNFLKSPKKHLVSQFRVHPAHNSRGSAFSSAMGVNVHHLIILSHYILYQQQVLQTEIVCLPLIYHIQLKGHPPLALCCWYHFQLLCSWHLFLKNSILYIQLVNWSVQSIQNSKCSSRIITKCFIQFDPDVSECWSCSRDPFPARQHQIISEGKIIPNQSWSKTCSSISWDKKIRSKSTITHNSFSGNFCGLQSQSLAFKWLIIARSGIPSYGKSPKVYTSQSKTPKDHCKWSN